MTQTVEVPPQNGYYRIANVKHQGSMFCSNQWSGWDHAVGMSPTDKEGTVDQPAHCAGKWRWYLERQEDDTYKITSAQVGGELGASQRHSQPYHAAVLTTHRQVDEASIHGWRWWITHEIGEIFKIVNVGGAGALGCMGTQFSHHTDDLQVACHQQEVVGTNWTSMHWHLKYISDQ